VDGPGGALQMSGEAMQFSAREPVDALVGPRQSSRHFLDVERSALGRPWRARLDAADVPNGGVNDLMGVVCDPYLRDSGFFQSVDHPSEGRLTTMPFPVSFSETAPDRNLPPAHLGEHTEAVLAELGYDADEIAAITAP